MKDDAMLSEAGRIADPRVSVIICTYNRSAMLSKVLESIQHLNIPADLDWELLVVDNNSPDQTKEVVSGFLHKMPVRYIFEPQQGKSFALNRAVREAGGDLLLFTDDDVKLDPRWIQEIVRAARKHPTAGWFGGRIDLWWADRRPKWLRDDCLKHLRGYLVLYDLGKEERFYADLDDSPAGANVAVRRATFEAVGMYREDMGPRGSGRGGCEDAELISRARAAALPGVYVPSAVCEHHVPSDRLRLRQLFAFGRFKGEELMAADPSHDLGSIRRAILYALRGVWQLAKGRRDRLCVCWLNVGLELGGWRARRKGRRAGRLTQTVNAASIGRTGGAITKEGNA